MSVSRSNLDECIEFVQKALMERADPEEARGTQYLRVDRDADDVLVVAPREFSSRQERYPTQGCVG